VADDLRRRLQADFAPDVERLSGMLGRDMAALWWPERSRRVAA
jgi:hypothetical protein